MRHPGRVLFGTDLIPPQREAYEIYFRFLETEDEYFRYSPDDPPPTNGVPTNSVSGAPMLDFPAAPASSGVLSNGLTLAKGAYAGLFYETNGVNVLSSGYFSVTTTERGTYSGKVTLGHRSWPVCASTAQMAFPSSPRPK